MDWLLNHGDMNLYAELFCAILEHNFFMLIIAK